MIIEKGKYVRSEKGRAVIEMEELDLVIGKNRVSREQFRNCNKVVEVVKVN